MIKSAKSGARGITHGLLVVLFLMEWSSSTLNTTYAATKPGGDLFEQAYVYLIRGDEKFTTLASNYVHTLPSPDTMFTIEIRAIGKTPADTFANAPHYLNLSVTRPMALRLIVADSTTLNLIAFEFKNLPAGEYSIGAEDWPTPLLRIFEVHRRCSFFFAVDQKYQGRFRFERDSNFKMIRIEKPVVRRD